MTIPLIISNADRIELRNIMKHLEVGRKAKFDGLEGTIEFVSDEYITLPYTNSDIPVSYTHLTLPTSFLV